MRGAARGAPGWLLAAFAVFGSGCNGIPEAAYRLPSSTLEVREMQTRSYEVDDEAEIIGASVALLQDMEYNIDEVEPDLGLLTASKVVDADSAAQKAGLIAMDVLNILLSALSGSASGDSAYATADDWIQLRLTLVVLPSLARQNEYVARVTVHSELRDKAHMVKEQAFIEEPEIYEEIFAKLSKSLFLERNIE